MNNVKQPNWQQLNQAYLAQAIANVKRRLKHCLGAEVVQQYQLTDSVQLEPLVWPERLMLPRLDLVTQRFKLSAFARDLLVLCLGIELDSEIPLLCALLHGEPSQNYPSLGLAMGVFAEVDWQVLTPQAPLRFWQLLELGEATSFTAKPLRIAERILHYVLGADCLDERLANWKKQNPSLVELSISQRTLIELLGQNYTKASHVIQLAGGDTAQRYTVAYHAAQAAGCQLLYINAVQLPSQPAELELIGHLLLRELCLDDYWIMLEIGEQQTVAWPLLNCLKSYCILSLTQPLTQLEVENLVLRVPELNSAEQEQVWRQQLDSQAEALQSSLSDINGHFRLTARQISNICLQIKSTPSIQPSLQRLWQLCREQLRQDLTSLVQVKQSTAGWQDLILAPLQKQLLQTIAAHIRRRQQVYYTWGFAAKSERGLGISALFAGPSGTGKTLAAEILANELQLDLYHIDLSALVSKYIGETEKNLKQVFDVAERSGAILLFDEADALFSKRSEVKDSHDRYANIEVSYLLQRMEAYQGLSILTTNLKSNLDEAFLRRLRFVVNFQFPDAAQRAEIWRYSFPANLPTAKLDLKKLAQLNLSGGNIKNVALNAAFLAADEQQVLTMQHILQAAQQEYYKLGRTLLNKEVGDW